MLSSGISQGNQAVRIAKDPTELLKDAKPHKKDLASGRVRSGCSPSLLPLQQSVAKVNTNKSRKGNHLVPVVTFDRVHLMPCSAKRARLMIESRKATPFWKLGIFCIRLNVEPSARILQPIALGIDPGSKKEGFSVVSKKHTLLNLQADARTGIKEKLDNRRGLRNARRSRKTPCRARRLNRSCLKNPGMPPSTKARWDWKLRLVKKLMRIYPIQTVVVEDIAAVTKPWKRKWNVSFSPLAVGKTWFYGEIRKLALLVTKQGWETKALRDTHSLKKLKDKMSSDFHAHCVDAWVLAAEQVQASQPTQKQVMCVIPLDFRRRSLHKQVPAKGGLRRLDGGTRSQGCRRGSLVKSLKYGITYLGGSSNGCVSVHDLATGCRLSRNVRLSECKLLNLGGSSRSFWG